jgi:hypothetical protein
MSVSRLYAHRGLWNEGGSKILEPNSKEAILKAISKGFGVETDIRDFLGDVIVSHDPATNGDFTLRELLQLKGNYALNIKCDGLPPMLNELTNYSEYFLFDMSIPEYQKYLKSNLSIFGRMSEYESANQYKLAAGFWVDGFLSDWWCTSENLEKFAQSGLRYVFVSPELHGRDPEKSWRAFAPYFQNSGNFSLCTDHPDLFMELL